jgi:hypothetical protein
MTEANDLNSIESPRPNRPSKAVELIDQNLAKAAATLDDIADRIARAGADGDAPMNFTSSAVKQIEALNDRLQSVDGDRIVERSKETIERHPTALTIAAAVIGATIAQVAVMAVRNERRRLPQQQGA